ncbi:MAG: RecX family transcriptional regulator [Anaerolineae bacterium]|jgi:regulatory protein|nr:RecX family transcriptional regulator [Anaerolineae bacterium]MBT3712292.1 RecX family transcriptional regulator [Anaerolineae bacterium]MBT4311812.1 RecX family transcriptional regulator [Anaerolineae bacterium]MBT4456682.1 RecX family transcriptional regulator [Anaerolineae bacterium]MBT4843304.1 RecX family transcriptional regulator [Anaerolineae bacterium]
MKKITAIKAQRKNTQRVSVFLDGEFAFGLTRAVAGWLQVGQILGEEKIASLKNDDELEMAYLRAINFLSYRSRSSREIRQNLRKYEVPEPLIEPVIERLEEKNFLNDKEFAQNWVENRNTFRPRGRRALSIELRQKGISDETIQTTLDELVDEEKLVYQAGIKKARKLARRELEWQDFRKKLAAFLARRGFNYGIFSPLLSQLWEEVQDEKNE